MNCRPVLIAATAVVPDPITLSKTTSPSFVYVRIRYSNKATGFCVGCTRLTLFNSPAWLLNNWTVLGNLFPLSLYRLSSSKVTPYTLDDTAPLLTTLELVFTYSIIGL